MDYYIASEQGPLGPYNIEQLKERRLKAEDMVWRNGMSEWTRADELAELEEVLNMPATPPVFNRERFDAINNTTAGVQKYHDNTPHTYIYEDDEKCPPTFRWLAIIAFFGIIPCAIVALIKSVMVTRLWEEGKHDDARYQSRKALQWGLIGAIVGIPLSIYILFFTDDAQITQNIIDQLL